MTSVVDAYFSKIDASFDPSGEKLTFPPGLDSAGMAEVERGLLLFNATKM
jgi:hypothetical protein